MRKRKNLEYGETPDYEIGHILNITLTLKTRDNLAGHPPYTYLNPLGSNGPYYLPGMEVYVNGVDQGHLVGLRDPSYDGPITDVTSNDIICNGGPNPLVYISDVIIPATTGSEITTEWHHTLTSAGTGDPADPIDSSHKGPIITYLAAVPNATQSDVTGLKWFKIYEDGLSSDGTWAVDRLIANQGKVTFTLPSCIPDGQYLMRHEIIALHAASTYPGAQFYMECAQLNVSGGGTAQPETVSFPGVYAGSDPGITINIYQPLTEYTIPGPSVFTC